MTAPVPAPLAPREAAASLALWRAAIDAALPRLRALGEPRLDPRAGIMVVYIADHPHPAAEFALRQCLAMLGEEVGLHLFVPEGTRDPLAEQVKRWPGAVMQTVGAEGGGRLDRDKLLRSEAFWDRVRGELLLFIDYDTIVRHGSLEPFAEYDYLAPPWGAAPVSAWCPFGSGALSLRRRRAMREICRTCNVHPGLVASESVLFSVVTRLESARYRVADEALARRFAVESVFHPDPFALHKAWRYIEASRLEALLEAVGAQDGGG